MVVYAFGFYISCVCTVRRRGSSHDHIYPCTVLWGETNIRIERPLRRRRRRFLLYADRFDGCQRGDITSGYFMPNKESRAPMHRPFWLLSPPHKQNVFIDDKKKKKKKNWPFVRLIVFLGFGGFARHWIPFPFMDQVTLRQQEILLLFWK